MHHVSVSGDAWARLAALRRFRAVLEGGGACVLLADGRMGAPIHMPFFRGETTITLGAFYLGHAARSPVLPFFGVMPDHRLRLRVEIAPALASAKGSSGAALGAVAEEFFGVYRAYVRRYPSHLPYRFVRAEPSAP